MSIAATNKSSAWLLGRYCSPHALLQASEALLARAHNSTPPAHFVCCFCNTTAQVKYHEGTFEALRAAGAPAEGPAYADAGEQIKCCSASGVRVVCQAHLLLRLVAGPAMLLAHLPTVQAPGSEGCIHLLAALPPADTAAQALMAAAPVGVTHYRLERLQLS